jgi:hypothetical protein
MGVLWLQLLAFRLCLVTVSRTKPLSTFSHTVHLFSRYYPCSHSPHVSCGLCVVLPYLPSYAFLLPDLLTAFATSGIFFPLETSAFLVVGLLRFPSDSIEVTTFCTSEIQPGWVPPQLSGNGCPQSRFERTTSQISHHHRLSHISMTQRDAASSEVHFRSPVQFFPRLVASCVEKLP